MGDSIVKEKNFLVGRNLDEINQIVSEVEIIEHQDISNAEQLVIIESKKLLKVKNIDLNQEYPMCSVVEHNDIGLPPSIIELDELENKIKKMTAKLIEQGLNTNIPEFVIDSENRLIKLWELCIYTPMDLKIKNVLINENDISKRFVILSNYVDNVIKY
jgi:hypothetical protein